ncbi:MAG: Ku protein [Acidimicrobiales bacterium]
MPRAIWSGAISFGLVSIPVKLYAATTSKTVRFHQLDAETGSRVRQQRVSEADGTEVPYERIVKGYELSSGRHVVISDDDLAAIDPTASRTIDLLEFVPQESIDPLYYDAAYYLGPDPATAKPYALLLRAMAEADKVGIARFVMRGKEHLCALRPDEGVLVLSTMRYADEVRTTEDIAEIETANEVQLSDAELAMAGQLIASLDATFDPERYHDTYREKVLDLIAAKERGEEMVEAPEAEEGAKVVDLMAALQASVAEAKQSRGRHPSAGAATTTATTAAAKKKAPATKAPAKKKAGGTRTAKKAPAKSTAKKATAKKAAGRRKADAERKSA